MSGTLKKLSLHCLQHSPTEGPANVAVWAAARGHSMSVTHVYREEESFPDPASFDALIVMGGPMGTYDEAEHPWLAREKAFLKEAIRLGKKVLGICLGAQLIAEVTGGRVYRGEFSEIGWFQIELSDEATGDPLFADFPPRFTALQWHHDTFELPPGAQLLAGSQVYPHQAFRIGDNILALQFHPEVTEDLLITWVESSLDDFPHETFVQRPQTILNQAERLERLQKLLNLLLDRFLPIR